MTLSGLRTLLGLGSAGLFGWLLWISNTHLSPDGFGLFDGRAAGYDLDYAQAYLAALEEAGRAVYLGLYRVVDTLFPIAFAGFLALMTLDATQGFRPIGRLFLMVPPVAYLVVDLVENALIAGMISAGPEGLDAAQVELASQFTMMKYAILLATALGLGSLKIMGRRV